MNLDSPPIADPHSMDSVPRTTIPRILKVLTSVAPWFGTVLLGGYIGSEWPLRGVPQEEIGPGEGIGMMLFGGFGMFVGALVGLVVVAVFLRLVSRSVGR